mgnify:CR=1 FL=1
MPEREPNRSRPETDPAGREPRADRAPDRPDGDAAGGAERRARVIPTAPPPA